MDDINLIQSDAGHYDWHFKNRQLQNVTGAQQLICAVRHMILLRKNELIQQIYQGKGNNLYSYIKLPGTDETQKLIIDEIRSICKEIENIKDAHVEINKKDNNVFITQITIEKKDGGLVEVGI